MAVSSAAGSGATLPGGGGGLRAGIVGRSSEKPHMLQNRSSAVEMSVTGPGCVAQGVPHT